MRNASYALNPPRVEESKNPLQLDLDYLSLDAQLRNFTASREAARGRADASASYRALRLQRDKAAAQLETLGPVVHRSEAPLPARSIAAARLRDGLTPWFGFSGTVQCGRAEELRQWDSPGCKGQLYTHALDDTGAIFFGANIAGGPIEGHPVNEGTYDPDHPQLWIHVWNYLVPFPAPAVDSILTCEFEVHAQFAVVLAIPPGRLFSKVWAGLMPDMTVTQVVNDTQQSFPVNGIALAPDTGYVRGRTRVQLSCRVRAGKTPAMQMLTYASVALLDENTDLILSERESFIVPKAAAPVLEGAATLHRGGNGLISFHYEPDLVLHQ